MVIKETAWGFLIDQGQMGRCVWGAEKNEIIELNKTCRGIARARFSRATCKETKSTTGCA